MRFQVELNVNVNVSFAIDESNKALIKALKAEHKVKPFKNDPNDNLDIEDCIMEFVERKMTTSWLDISCDPQTLDDSDCPEVLSSNLQERAIQYEIVEIVDTCLIGSLPAPFGNGDQS